MGSEMCIRDSVSDVMRGGAALPIVRSGATLAEAIVEMGGKGMGMTAVVDGAGRVVGIVTDGDLRRAIARVRDVAAARVDDVMTRSPRTIVADRLAIDCVELMETPPKVSQLLVVVVCALEFALLDERRADHHHQDQQQFEERHAASHGPTIAAVRSRAASPGTHRGAGNRGDPRPCPHRAGGAY